MRVYLDFNASTPVAPEVAARMQAVLNELFGNPSSDHWAGKLARDTVEKARAGVAAFLGCDAGEVVFASGGSEANNHALMPRPSRAERAGHERRHSRCYRAGPIPHSLQGKLLLVGLPFAELPLVAFIDTSNNV